MTPEQLAVFKLFHSEDLNQGENWFNIDIPNPDGNDFTDTEVRFLGGYQEKLESYNNWSVQAEIEYQEASILPSGSFTIVTNPDGSIDWPQNLLGYPSSFTIGYNPANAISSIDNARLNIRARATQRTEIAKVLYQFDQEQYAIFRYTFEVHLNQGNDWFRVNLFMPDKLTNVTEVWARFASNYVGRYVGVNNWDVETSLEYQIPDDLFNLIERDDASFEILTLTDSSSDDLTDGANELITT